MNFTNFSGVLTISRDIMIECALIVATTDAYIVAAAGIGPESYEKRERARVRNSLLIGAESRWPGARRTGGGRYYWREYFVVSH